MDQVLISQLLWKISWQAALLAMVVWVVCRIASRAPAAWRHALWLIVLVKFFVPPFAYFPSELAFWQQAEYTQPPVTAKSLQMFPAPGVGQFPPRWLDNSIPDYAIPGTKRETPYVVWGIPPAPVSAYGVPLASDTEDQFDLSRVALWIWLAGACLMLIVLVIRRVRQSRVVRSSKPADDRLLNLLAHGARSLRVSRVPKTALSSEARTPMLVGFLRPTILIPEDIAGSCSERNLSAVLLHELAHVKRRDMWVLWLQQAAQVLFYFHPALWMVGRELKKERELACDELVLSRSGIRKDYYAAGYVWALKLASGVRGVSTSLGMAEPFDVEKRRLRMILGSTVPSLSGRWIAALVVAAAIGLPTFAGISAKLETARELLANAMAARKDLADLVKSGRGHLTIRSWSNRPDTGVVETQSEYDVAFSGERFRLSAQSKKVKNRPGVSRQPDLRMSYDGRDVTLEVGSRPDVKLDANSSRGRMMVESYRRVFDPIDRGYPDLAKVLLYHENEPQVLGYENVNGDRCVVVQSVQAFRHSKLEPHQVIRRLWINPAKGYTVPRMRVWKQGGPYKQKVLMSETGVEYRRQDGLWIPSRYAHTEYRTNPRTGKSYKNWDELAVYAQDFHLNVPVTEKDLGPASGTSRRKEPSLQDTTWLLPLKARSGEPRIQVVFINSREILKRVKPEEALLAGLTAIKGPGVTVTLRDSPHRPKDMHPGEKQFFRVHDSDIRNIVNELWAAGAQAVSINDQRLVATSSIRFAGAAVMVNSVPLTAPFVVRAIGSPDTMGKLLGIPGGVQEQLSMLGMINIEESEVTVPAYHHSNSGTP